MTWFGIVFVCSVVLSSAISVAKIGQPRKALTPGEAVIVLAINALFIWGAITVGTVQP